MYHIQEEPVGLSQVFVGIGPDTGEVLIFAETVRVDRGDILRLETDEEEAEREIPCVISEAEEKWELTRVQVVHQNGSMKGGDVIVLITVVSGHRDLYLTDELKVTVPIQKEELFEERVAGFRVQENN